MCVFIVNMTIPFSSSYHFTGSKLCIKSSSVSYDGIMSIFDSTVGVVSVHVDIWAITNWLLMYRSVYVQRLFPG